MKNLGKKGILALFLGGSIFPGALKEEFLKSKDQAEKKYETVHPPEVILSNNLLYALRRALRRYFHDPEWEKVDPKNIQYERAENDPFAFYVKYKNYIGYIVYEYDPQKFYQFPVREDFYIRGKGGERPKKEAVSPEEER